MKIELKHLSPYLPYGLEVKLEFLPGTGLPWYYEDKDIFTLEGMMLDWYGSSITSIVPYLIPLSEEELTKKQCLSSLETKGSFADFISTSIKDSQKNFRLLLDGKSDSLEQWKFERLIQFHFDVFGLIDNGLALNKINYRNK